MENRTNPEGDSVEKNPYRKALNILRKEGWIKSNFKDKEGWCLVGAVAYVTGDASLGICLGPYHRAATRDAALKRIYSLPVLDLLNEIANEQFPERTPVRNSLHPACVFFNDSGETEFDDVVLVLEKAAVRWDEQVR